LTKPGAPRFLISEAVRGEGAYLVDDAGRRFAFDYHPGGELAPRDVVSRAIYSYLQKVHADPTTANVWLDLCPISPEQIRQRFPNIIQVCQEWGIDVFSEAIPVAPAAHYWMGGVAVDLMNRTSLAGLYVVGEAASTGVHGANRLASNSLLECLVFGAQLEHLELLLDWIQPELVNTAPQETEIDRFPEITSDSGAASSIAHIRRELPRLMWQSAGICRDSLGLQGAIAQVEQWLVDYAQLPLSQSLQQLPAGKFINLIKLELEAEIRQWSETRNLLEIANLILKSAAYRTESRGGHYRKDFPATDPNWRVHTLVQAGHWWQSAVKEQDTTSVG
jgi:L-aspartate oxidase